MGCQSQTGSQSQTFPPAKALHNHHPLPHCCPLPCPVPSSETELTLGILSTIPFSCAAAEDQGVPQACGTSERDVSDMCHELVSHSQAYFFWRAGLPSWLLLALATPGCLWNCWRKLQGPTYQLWSCFLFPWPLSYLAKVPLNNPMVLGIHQLPLLKLMVFHAPSRLLQHSTCPTCCSMCSPAPPVLCRSLLGEDHTGPMAKGKCPVRSRAGRNIRCFPGGASGPPQTLSKEQFLFHGWNRPINSFIAISSGCFGSAFENSVSHL